MPRLSKDNVCPTCGKSNNEVTGLGESEGKQPTPGAITICLYCQEVCVFGDDLTMELPDPKLRKELYEHPLVRLAIREIRNLTL